MESFTWGGKKIGTLNNGVLTKHVVAKNYMRIQQTWGLDKGMIDSLNDDIVVKLKAPKSTYEATVALIKSAKYKDYGWGAQYFLPLKEWKKL